MARLFFFCFLINYSFLGFAYFSDLRGDKTYYLRQEKKSKTQHSFQEKKPLSFFKKVNQETVLAPPEDAAFSLEEAIRDLTQKIEQLTHENERLKQKFADIEMRLDQTEAPQTLGKSLGSPPPLSQPEEKSFTESTVQQPILPLENTQDQYLQALNLLKQGQTQQARIELVKFIEKNKGNKLLGQAMYWLGTTYFLEEDYENAIQIFEKTFSLYPHSPKASETLLKLAKSFSALGRTKEACQTLKKFFEAMPALKKRKLTPLEEEAKQEAKRLKCYNL